MPITITSTTDSPEDVAAAMSASGAEIEKDEVVEESKSAAEVKDKPEPKEGEKTEESTTDDSTKTETETAEPEDDESTDDSTDAEGTDTTDTTKPKKITGYKKRALRAEEENKLLLDLLKKQSQSPEREEAAEVQTDSTPQTYSGIPEPKLEDFKDETDPYAAFTVKHSKWAMGEVEAKLRAERQQEQVELQRDSYKKSFNDRLTTVRKPDGIYADYDEVLDSIKGLDLPITPLMQGLIMSAKAKDGTPLNVDVMYYLAAHPEECREISAMTPAEQAAEMGAVRVAALAESERRTKELSSKSKTKSETKTKADADVTLDAVNSATATPNARPKPKAPPAPIKPVGKRTAPAAGDLAAVAESGDFKAYEQQRARQGFKYR